MTITPGISWTEERVAFLREMWGFVSAPEIARELGATTNSVIGKANRLRLTPISAEKRYAYVRAGYARWQQSGRVAK